MTILEKLREVCNDYFHTTVLIAIILIAIMAVVTLFFPLTSLILSLNLVGLLVVSSFVSITYFLKTNKQLPDDNYLQLHDALDALIVTIQEINSEKEVLESGLDQRAEQLERCKILHTNSAVFFKPASVEQANLSKCQLQKLQQVLKTSLDTYPQFDRTEASQLSYVVDSHRQYKEHHVNFRDITEEYFKECDEFLCHLTEPINESIQRIAI